MAGERGASEGWTTPALTVWMVAAVVMIGGCLVPAAGLWRVRQLCLREPAEVCVPKPPAVCHYARWQASSMLGVAAGTGVVYFAFA